MVKILMTPAGSSDLPASVRSSLDKSRGLSDNAPKGIDVSQTHQCFQLDNVRGIAVPKETVCFRGPIPLNVNLSGELNGRNRLMP